MSNPRKHDAIRFSVASRVTEDSIDSTGLATPVDSSPPQPSNTFPIINIVNDDPLPSMRSYPDVTYVNRRRAQTSPRPVPTSIVIQSIPQQQPTIISSPSKPKESYKLTSFWPKIKRSILFNAHTSSGEEGTSPKPSQLNHHKPTRWFHKNRVQPQ